MFAPTLLDIAHQLDVGVGVLSVVFLARATGGVIGTVGSGVVMDRFPKQQYTFLCCAILGAIVGMYEMKQYTFYTMCVCVCQSQPGLVCR